jgi:hypothetical protein
MEFSPQNHCKASRDQTYTGQVKKNETILHIQYKVTI